MNRQVALRALLVAIAVGGIVVSAIWLAGHHDYRQARQVVLNPRATPAQFAHGLREADGATRLNPSSDADIVKFGLLVRSGRPGAARRVFDSIVRREPDNASAWFGLAIATQRSDPATFRRALARLQQLNPLLGSGR
jgi:hypothetical protein